MLILINYKIKNSSNNNNKFNKIIGNNNLLVYRNPLNKTEFQKRMKKTIINKLI